MFYGSKNGLEDAGTEIEANLFHELYYHFLGTDQAEDVLCWRDSKHAQWFSRAEVTHDGKVICKPTSALTTYTLLLLFPIVGVQ